MCTCPSLDVCVDPALMLKPFGEELGWKQWAAERSVLESKIVAPQKWKDPVWTDTCHGMGVGASSPPTIFPKVINEGILARIEM